MLTREDGALQAVRRRHELRVLEALVENGPRTRRELEEDTKLSRTTLSAIVGDLRQRGVLAESVKEHYGEGRNGRPTKVLTLDPTAGAAVGIELGRARISVTVAGFDGSSVAHELLDIDPAMELAAKVSRAVGIVRSLVDSGVVRGDSILGIGVGVASRHADPASLADDDTRQSDPQGASFEELRLLLDAPLLWDNNIRLAAMAESARYALASEDLLYVVLSTGISCSVVVKGSPLRGGNGLAGELGHTSVDFEGKPCWCGGVGCLESYLGVANVLAEAAARGGSFASIAALAAAADDGDEVALGVIAWAGTLLGRAMATAAMIVDPSRVVVAGELSQCGDRLLEPVRAALAARQLNIGNRSTVVGMGASAPSSGSDGAALMALRHWALDSV
ncbi:ROK family transcriptional regulator [Arthrobacter sp. 35W]|uniref:ROK family transcriptional regulator n=1 Tax=Arthrobacter sp. 35W TaxID=1132441 RepID=UPI0004090EA9|nr:ROK family transcriptional regulator [Arthrobacter sp. 35W]